MSGNCHLYLLLFSSMFLLSGCGKDPEQKKTSGSENAIYSHFKQQNVPVPVGFTPVANHTVKTNDEHTKVLCYTGRLNLKQSITFYKQSMELDGWDIQDFSTTREGLIFCNKSGKHCAISIRPIKNSQNRTSLKVVVKENVTCHGHSCLSNNQNNSINRKTISVS